MPNVTMTLTDTTQSVSRPVAIDIIQQVKEIVKINKNAEIYYLNDLGQNYAAGTTVDNKNDRYARMANQKSVWVEVEELHNKDNLTTKIVSKEEHIPIFLDKALGVTIRPVYQSTDLVISFKYRTNSKSEAKRWLDDIGVRTATLRDVNLHTLTYHYTLPTEIWDLLFEIYSKRENRAGYGNEFFEYVRDHSTNRLKLVGTQTGTSKQLVISERQARVIGLMDFEMVPEKPEHDGEMGMYIASFNYKLTYDRPEACNVLYPVIVHNQLLDTKFIEFSNNDYRLDTVPKTYSQSFFAFNEFESTTILDKVNNQDLLLRLPKQDDWVKLNDVPGMAIAIVILLELDTVNPNILFNLKELGDYAIDPDFLEFIQMSEYPYMTKLYKSIFNLSLYENKTPILENGLTVDSNLNVISTKTLDPRKQYRVVFSLVVDPTYLDVQAFLRMKKFPKALAKYIVAANELLANYTDVQALATIKRLENWHLSWIYYVLTGQLLFANSRGMGLGDGLLSFQSKCNSADNYLFRDIPLNLLKQYRGVKTSMKTVQFNTLIILKKEDLNGNSKC